MNIDRTFAKAGLLIGGLVLGIGLLELGCRHFNPQPPLALTSTLLNRGRFTNPGVHHNHQQEFSVTLEANSNGFVDYEWGDSQPTDILLIGDSFVQGAQVPMDQSIGRRLHNTLPQNVKSIGVPGAGTTAELLLLEQWIDVLEPNIVILGFLPSNDILNNHPELESKSDKPFADLTEWRQSQTLSIQFAEPTLVHPGLSTHSHLMRWFIRTQHTNKIQQSKFTKGSGVPIDWHVYNPEIDETWAEAWSITGGLFQRINELCVNKGVLLRVVLFPSIEEISDSYVQEIQTAYPTTQNWIFEDGLETQSQELLISAGIDPTQILSLYPVFTSHQQKDSLYYRLDHHWTPQGHQLASKEIKDWLKSQ